MAASNSAALRYAHALSQVVAEQHLDSASVEQQLKDFNTMLGESSELREVLINPSIPEPQKLRFLDALSSRTGISTQVRNFIALIAKHERMHEFGDMVEAFHTLADQAAHVAEAQVISAHPLDEAARKLIEQKIADMTGDDRVKATYTQDPSLIGGAVVKVGSTVYDGSVRAQLEQMKQRLVNAA
ncbi:ATP synthase F1 subunit delta [Granulicella cerasi]|uniref:ATP synthase subunit delta n=1 Tax=Granulicella cerasi TaxID=741063 RepID=A0ABW1Z5J3_9BACT|nr:ATP synthase F1 subunit delta [Granulicella cerasi]